MEKTETNKTKKRVTQTNKKRQKNDKETVPSRLGDLWCGRSLINRDWWPYFLQRTGRFTEAASIQATSLTFKALFYPSPYTKVCRGVCDVEKDGCQINHA